jgi:hypothetical protein
MAIPGLLAILERPVSYARRFIAFIADYHHVGDMDRRLELDNSGLPGLTLGLGMPLYHVKAFHDHFIFIMQGFAHFALLAPVLAGYNEHIVILLNLHLRAPLERGKLSS